MRNSMPAMRSPPNVYDKVSGELRKTLPVPNKYDKVAGIVNEVLIKKDMVNFTGCYWGPQPLVITK